MRRLRPYMRLLLVATTTVASALFGASAAGSFRAGSASSVPTLPQLAVYLHSGGGKHGIYLFDADGRRAGWVAGRIAADAGCWSPGGRSVAITTPRDRLEIIDKRSGSARFLPVGSGWFCHSWSPNGRFLLAVKPVPNVPGQSYNPRCSCAVVVRRLALIPLAGGRPLTLAFGRGAARSPVWSPNSRTIAFLRLSRFNVYSTPPGAAGRPELLTVGRHLRVRPLGPKGLRATRLSWAPSGKTLVLETGTSGFPTAAGSLATLDLRSGRVLHLGRGHDATWSPRGALAWACAGAVCIRPPGGGRLLHIRPPLRWRPRKNGGYDGLSWSPDGKRLVFEASPDPDSSRLVLTGADGRAVHLLYTEESNEQQGGAVWAPGGRYIAFWSGLFRDTFAIYTIRLGATRATFLRPPMTNDEGGFVWRPIA